MQWPTEECRFVLDVDPEKLREAARKVALVGREFDDRGTRIAAEPAKIGDSWTGKAARNTKTEIRGLARHLGKFVDGLDGTRESLLKLARRYELELETVERLNKRWREADEDYDDALGEAGKAYGKRADEEDVPVGSRALRMGLDPTYQSDKSDAEAARKATRDRLQRRFDDVQAELRAESRLCGLGVEAGAVAGGARPRRPVPVPGVRRGAAPPP